MHPKLEGVRDALLALVAAVEALPGAGDHGPLNLTVSSRDGSPGWGPPYDMPRRVLGLNFGSHRYLRFTITDSSKEGEETPEDDTPAVVVADFLNRVCPPDRLGDAQ